MFLCKSFRLILRSSNFPSISSFDSILLLSRALRNAIFKDQSTLYSELFTRAHAFTHGSSTAVFSPKYVLSIGSYLGEYLLAMANYFLRMCGKLNFAKFWSQDFCQIQKKRTKEHRKYGYIPF